MQRDMDFVRDLLLRIANAEVAIDSDELLPQDPDDADRAKLVQHLLMLTEEAGFVKGEHIGEDEWVDLDLTWNGHEFLDHIRDPEMWRQTKAGATKIGDWSLKAIGSIAEGILKARIDRFLAGTLG